MRFIHSETFKEEGLSKVYIKHKGRVFKGFAKCNPNDTWSEFTGCQFAELRATLKALKAEYREEKFKVEAIRNFVTATTQYKKFDKDSDTAKAMYRQYNRRVKNLERIAEDIQTVKEIIAARMKALNNISNKKEDKGN